MTRAAFREHSEDPVVEALREVLRSRSLKNVANEIGISTGYLAMIAYGWRTVPDYVAAWLGYERVTTWKKLDKKVQT
jgi:hypothetical protein